VTEKIISLLESGVIPWRKSSTSIGLPRNLVNKRPEARQFWVSYVNARAELACCGGVESPFDSKKGANLAFAKLPVSVGV
jgi:hypothetical protein